MTVPQLYKQNISPSYTAMGQLVASQNQMKHFKSYTQTTSAITKIQIVQYIYI